MSDDELFDLYMQDNKTILSSLRKIYNKGRAEAIKEYNISLKEHWIEEDDLSLSDEFFKYVDKVANQLKESK